MRRIGVVTSSRADYGGLRPVIRAIQADPELHLLLFVGGTHLSPDFGMTIGDIRGDRFPIADTVDTSPAALDVGAIVAAVGRSTMRFGEVFARHRPDIVLLLGDRYELLAPVTAALPLNIPVAHISGGDLTYGALDNQVRDAVTALSHLHFVGIDAHADRLRQMGERPDRIFVTGEPSLEPLGEISLMSRSALADCLGISLTQPTAVVTFHPTTRSELAPESQVVEVLSALDCLPLATVFTYPGLEPGSERVIERIGAFVATHPNAAMCVNLGTRQYFSLLSVADVMVGNSSSGILEAPSFLLPVVNVGERQDGRLRARNVIDVGFSRAAIAAAIQHALDPSFRASLVGLTNPYAGERPSVRIVSVLKSMALGPEFLAKRPGDIQRSAVPSGLGV